MKLFLVLWLTPVFLPALIVVMADPYQIFHPSWLSKIYFHRENERYQIAGLLKHYLVEGSGYDSIVIGSSMSSNITSNDMQSAFGWKALNLSIRAASLSERTFVLQQALNKPDVKQVLLEVYAADAIETIEPLEDSNWFPTSLYTDAWRDKQRYLFNISITIYALKLLDLQGLLAWLPDAARTYGRVIRMRGDKVISVAGTPGWTIPVSKRFLAGSITGIT